MPSSVALTFDILETANRLRGAAGRRQVFSAYASGSGARKASALSRAPALPAGIESNILVLPGLGLASEEELADWLLGHEAKDARRTIINAAQAGKAVAGSCSSTFLLASTGLLDGRRATTTWWLAPLFRNMFPVVELDADAIVISDRGIITAGAALAHVNLMLALVARFAAPSLAEGCARYMLLNRGGTQAHFMNLAILCSGDEMIAKAEAFAQGRLAEKISVTDLGAAAGLSPRTFARRVQRITGLTPVGFLRRLRVERATHLLETTRLPLEEIAYRVGYSEPSTLRRLLREHKGTTAREMRAAKLQDAMHNPA